MCILFFPLIVFRIQFGSSRLEYYEKEASIVVSWNDWGMNYLKSISSDKC
jgi:hypothetical protein